MLIKDVRGAKRLDDESFEDYKDRRRLENKLLRNHLKGAVRWVSRRNGQFIEVPGLQTLKGTKS